ncbi:MAG: hypothetical protein H6742_00260 [Alphaproteobacteria bacterium]|nr:hypothetical protein [Alphaproteobacteria bacterium]
MSTLRTFLAVGGLVISVGVYGYLLSKEQIAQGEVSADTVARIQDPLVDLAYTASSREEDFKAFGLDGDQVKWALDRSRRMADSDDGMKRLQLLMDDADDPVALADALCGQTGGVRPRYGALKFLVEEVQGQRRPIRLKRARSLVVQPWAVASPISGIFDELELADDRKDDATRMAIAGILAAKEGDVLNRYRPWGRGLGNPWSWDEVVEKNAGIEEHVLEYFVLMHLAIELANAEDGICQ